MGRFNSPRRSRILVYHSPRTSLLVKVLLLISCIITFQFTRLHFIYQAAIEAKYTPTDFGDANVDFTISDDQLRARQRLLAARSEWQQLGSGCEGTTFTYDDHVIKTFNPSKPLRNCIPAEQSARWTSSLGRQSARWPSEIPASILLAGREEAAAADTGFVPVTDFFLASAEYDATPHWHLVSPLVPNGNLFNLARRLHSDGSSPPDFRTLDERFRPAFHTALETLQKLHDAGFCHDDIKPENIFIGPDPTTDWLLGDLGNLRHLNHPYHTSRIWQINAQLPECRANDAFRLVKTHLAFLRAASATTPYHPYQEEPEPEPETATQNTFNKALFAGKEPWSRLYWLAHNAGPHLSASNLLAWSRVDEPASAPAHYVSKFERAAPGLWNPFLRLWKGRTAVVKEAVDEALAMKLGEKWGRWFAGSDWFGVPVADCP